TAGLERQLGVQLLVRHHARGLSLTRAGEAFLREARTLLAHAGEVADSAHGLGASLAGTLTVGCFSPLAPFYLPRLVHAFAERHPQVTVEIVEDETEGLRRALLDGRCEVALLYDLALGDDIDAELLASAAPYLAVAAEHRLARRGGRCPPGEAGVHLHDVADEPMVLLDLPHSREYFRALAEASGFSPQVRYRSTSYETVRALVGRGFGYTILNQQPYSDRTYDGGRVAVLPLLGPATPLAVVQATARGVRATVRARAWAALCREMLPALVPPAPVPTPAPEPGPSQW
ncbi:MAG: LysR substrate-binding domain-containing protein, partial [Acidimicrobiales bacterium]